MGGWLAGWGARRYDRAQVERLPKPLRAALATAAARGPGGVDQSSGLVRRCQRLLDTLVLHEQQTQAASVLEEQIHVSRESRELEPLRRAYVYSSARIN